MKATRILFVIFGILLTAWGLLMAPRFTILCGVVMLLLITMLSITKPKGRGK